MAENMRWLAMSRHHVPCLLDIYDTKFTTDKNQNSYKRLRSNATYLIIKSYFVGTQKNRHWMKSAIYIAM